MKTYIYIGALLAVLGALAGAGWYVHTSAINKVRVELREQHGKNLARVTDASISLQGKKDTAYEELQNKLKSSDARAKLLSDQLRKRPSREASNAVSPDSGSSCTGARLFREDGEFLTGEAASANRLVEERNYYYERYEDARQQIERLKNGKD